MKTYGKYEAVGKYEKRSEAAARPQPKAKSALLQTYFTSLLCMVLCVTMFFGTSFAWFTSEVKSENNEINIGILEAKLEKQNDDGITWTDLKEKSEEKLFDAGIHWEPGYTAMETVKISNEGNLAFRYVLSFTDGMLDGVKNDAGLIEAARFFCVYVHAGEFTETDPKPDSFADIKASAEDEDGTWRAVGMGKEPATLADILTRELPVFSGNMEKEKESDIYTIALHMLETAGEGTEEDTEAGTEAVTGVDASAALMGKKIGMAVKLTGYQRTHEQDAFDAAYDLNAQVAELGPLSIAASDWIGKPTQQIDLDAAYQYLPVESYEEALNAPYKKYIADFVVWADGDIEAETVALAGYYDAWCSLNEDRWIVLTAPEKIPANKEIRLVDSMGSAFAVTYELLCQYGNDGIGFLCGVDNKSDDNIGKTITVELRLFEVVDGKETGRYTVAGTKAHTFTGSED